MSLPPSPQPAAQQKLALTPSQTVGPFLAIGLPWPDGPFVVPEGTPGAISISGHVLGRAAAFSGTPHTVTIRRGHTAAAKLQIVDSGNYPPSACHPVTAAGLRVYPPNQTRAKEVPFPYSACVSNGPVVLRVGPLQ